MSETVPDGIETELPCVVVDCVKSTLDAPLGEIPDVASVAVKPAYCVPRHQPLVPGTVHESPAGRSETVGGVASLLMVTELEDVPPPLVALQVRVVPVVSVEIVVGSHPLDEEMALSGSETVQLTLTFETYQPLLPIVPETWGVILGGVLSAAMIVTVKVPCV